MSLPTGGGAIASRHRALVATLGEPVVLSWKYHPRRFDGELLVGIYPACGAINSLLSLFDRCGVHPDA